MSAGNPVTGIDTRILAYYHAPHISERSTRVRGDDHRTSHLFSDLDRVAAAMQMSRSVIMPAMESDFFTHAEAEFALWDMQVRERDIAHATDVARRLAHNFPDNRKR
jgi:hypothetical protein